MVCRPLDYLPLKLAADPSGTPQLNLVWKNATGGTSPLIANGVLFYAQTGSVMALDPLTGKKLWSSKDQFIFNLWEETAVREIHWETPIVADGLLFIPDNRGNLFAYGIDAMDIQTLVGRILLAVIGGMLVIILASRMIKQNTRKKRASAREAEE